MTNEMVVKETGEIVETQQTPETLLIAARDAARALEQVLSLNERPPVMFNGKRFLEYPHWQTIAKFYHCSVKTNDGGYVEIAGVPGFKGSAEVIDEKTGIVIGSADAYCMRDEINWKAKPLFQLSSMAQTRAGSKALSNKFRYVAIVAGYEPTPAEEVVGDAKPTIQMPKAIVAPKPVSPAFAKVPVLDKTPPHVIAPTPEAAQAIKKPGVISDKQRKFLFAKTKAAGIEHEDLKAYLMNVHKIEHTADLPWPKMDEVIKWIDSQEKAPEIEFGQDQTGE